jgi:diguanylate cyclase (GGDEF)-like protein
MLCFDIDEFKYVNDSGGHQAGDALLRAVARELQQLIPSPVLTARLGGDEFAAVFRPMQAVESIQMARSLNRQVGKIELSGPWRSHKVSVSIGIALFPEHGSDAEEVLAHGNLALAQAREKGRGSWHLYSPKEQLMERMVKRGYWVEKIEQALAEDRFELRFQPIMALHDNCADHYEVLVRMRMLDGTLVLPGDFIGVAEATGLIRAIDRVVLRKAFLKLAQIKEGNGSVKLSVNLSGRSFEDPGLVGFIKEELERREVNPANVIFEITETAAVEDFSAARALMQAVQQLGCTFALDDFGVGFSSFHYVKNLPVDYVKIDGSFVRNLPQSLDDQVFVKVLVQAAKGFGKKTVAEFVENAEILALLREYGVDYAQGYFIGRPSEQPLAIAPLRLGA